MPSWTISQIAKCYGYCYDVTQRTIKALENEGSFKKTSYGMRFNDVDALSLSKLLGFNLPATPPAVSLKDLKPTKRKQKRPKRKKK